MQIQGKEYVHPLHAKFTSEEGMSLIELMLAVTIIGILATLVYPTFQQQILTARRGDGITHLLQLKVQQESFRMENMNYAQTAQLSLPASDYYNFTVTNVSANTYTLTANAKGHQLSDVQCLTMQINQSLDRTPAHCFHK